MKRSFLFAAALAASAAAQYGGGTIFQSLDATQFAGVNAVGCPGNGSLSTGEILTYSAGWPLGARSLYSAEALGAVLGDKNGDGKPFDWVNIDALHLVWNNTAFQPKPFDFRYSFEYDLVNGSGTPVITSGDVFKLTGAGTFQVTIPRASFVAALGYQTPATGYQLNLDGYAEMSDGSVLVSFKNDAATGVVGSATNVIHPIFGTPIAQTIYGSDVFVIRQPFGTQPAILLYRAADFQPIANTIYSSYTVTEIRDFDLQPSSSAANNPYDPLNAWNGGNRPQLVFHFYGDENIACTQAIPANPVPYYWALVQSAAGVGQYATNVAGAGSSSVVMDALALGGAPLPAGSAITLDTSPINSIVTPGTGLTQFVPQNAPGTNVTFIARNLAGGANQVAAFVLGFTTHPGYGYYLGSGGYNWLFININDPFLPLTLSPPLAPLLVTAVSDALGNASTPPFPIPAGTSGLQIWVQALQLGAGFPTSAPHALRIQ
jgi:hypothetical protein